MSELWSNWAGNQRALVTVAKPTTEAELAAAVARAAESGQRISAVGAGHSFTDVALSDGLLLSLENYDRVLQVDDEALTVTVQAGCRLNELSEFLWVRGLAIENLGDIDVQSIAGATATATHGTGLAFGNLSTNIVGMRMIAGDGSIVVCDEVNNAEILSAARVSVGALGIISTITLRVVPAFHLHAVEEPRRLDEVSESFPELVAENDHFEFFWVPHTGWAITKTNRRNLEPLAPRPRVREWYQKSFMENHAFGLVNRVGAAKPSLVPRLARIVPGSGRTECNDRSYRIFATPRRVKFLEMEYALPLDATMTALAEVKAWIERTGNPTMFPVEVRAVAADDIALSPAQGRVSGYIAVHVFSGTPHERYFHAVEAIMAAHDGRPHWGKLHYRTAADLAPAYPHWESFQAVRRRLDPAGVFQNAYANRVLGPL